jgi:hypothetical protein
MEGLGHKEEEEMKWISPTTFWGLAPDRSAREWEFGGANAGSSRGTRIVGMVILLPIFLLLTPLIGRAVTTTVTLPALQDAHVLDGGSSGTNFGTSQTVHAGYIGGPNYVALALFDVDLPGDSVITKAEMEVFVTSLDLTSGDSLKVQLPDGAWTENGVTWNNRPGALSSSESTVLLASGDLSTTIKIDVAAHVQAIVDGIPNHGFLIWAGQLGSGAFAAFGSRQNPTTSRRPRLRIEYETSTITVTNIVQQDSYVADGMFSGGNYGGVTLTQAGFISGFNYVTLFSFDLDLPEDSEIFKAELEMFIGSLTLTAGNTMKVQLADGAWTEGGVTWNNRPGPIASPATTFQLSTGNFATIIKIDVTEHVQAIANGTPDNGFVIWAGQFGTGCYTGFATRDSISPSNWPRLVIQYSVPSAPPGDINGDEIVNLPDVTAFGNLIAAGNAPSLEEGDINGDGEVNMLDVQALAQMIVD